MPSLPASSASTFMPSRSQSQLPRRAEAWQSNSSGVDPHSMSMLRKIRPVSQSSLISIATALTT